VPAPVRVSHRVQRSAQSVYINTVPPRARATRQLHIKYDDPATPSFELFLDMTTPDNSDAHYTQLIPIPNNNTVFSLILT